jgi:hypothetical protein
LETGLNVFVFEVAAQMVVQVLGEGQLVSHLREDRAREVHSLEGIGFHHLSLSGFRINQPAGLNRDHWRSRCLGKRRYNRQYKQNEKHHQ